MPARPSPLKAILLLGFGFSLFIMGPLGIVVSGAAAADAKMGLQAGFSLVAALLSPFLIAWGAGEFRKFWARAHQRA